MPPRLVSIFLSLCLHPELAPAADPASANNFKFDFGSSKTALGFTKVTPDTTYSAERGFGFEPDSAVVSMDRGGNDSLTADFITAEKPFYFSIRVPEGNYRVTVTLGDLKGESTTTIKAELRRLMLERVHTAPGQILTRSFMVNVRTPRITPGVEVRLKDREKTAEAWEWDEKIDARVQRSASMHLRPGDFQG